MINKKTIIAMMLALVGMAGQAKVYKSIKTPEVMVQADVLMGELKIDEVMMTDTVSADTTIILNYGGMMDVDTITISKSSATFKQLQEAEAVIQGLTEQYAKKSCYSQLCAEPSRQRWFRISSEPCSGHE